MADVTNVKVGSGDSESIMYNKYLVPFANQLVYFTSLVPKDNSKVWNSVMGEWQVNDGWEIEILSSKKVAIKKFRIDTWGLRKIFNLGGSNDTDPATISEFLSFRVKVSGLDYVHNNVVYQEDALGNKTYGFVKAFAGNNGYNVYWYPGQFTSGNYIQGLGIQGGVGYGTNANERDDGLQMGKHPWDIGSRVAITDGEVKGTWFDVSYNAITLGLFGGYQTATSWHEYTTEGYTGNAYKVYDISDTPIIIDLNVDDTANAKVDPSTIECWDMYVGDTQVYHKDKTRENCWAKYSMMFPENYNYIKANLTISDSTCASWINPNQIYITKVPAGGLTITKVNTTKNVESSTQSYQALGIKVVNKPDDITAKFARTFTNVTENYDEEYTLVNGTTSIPAFSQKMYLTDQSVTCNFTEFGLSLSADTDTECNIVIELIPVFNEDTYRSVTLSQWSNLSKPILPEVTDKLIDMDKTLWNCRPTNTDFWDSIKDWFSNNTINWTLLTKGLFRSSNLDEIKLRITGWRDDWNSPEYYMWASGPFRYSDLNKITLESVNGSTFSVGNSLFSGCSSLQEIEVVLPEGTYYLCGSSDFSGMFERTTGGLKTFPNNLIRYDRRGHAFEQGISCSLTNYWFDYSSIETIPIAGGGDRFAEENHLILHRYAQQTFNVGSTLKYIGPVLDMILVHPESNSSSIFRCEGLTDARIKNLNHGSWNLDGVTRGLYHGNLPSLDAESVAYLFENLTDLTTCNPEVHEERIDKSFRLWSSSYWDSWSTEFWTSRVAIRYFETRVRNSSEGIVATNQTFTDMAIVVTGLQETDVLWFGSTEITTNGTHYITKANTNWEAFILRGDASDTTNVVRVVIQNGLDYTNPIVSSATLYCPNTWNGTFIAANAGFTLADATAENNKVIITGRGTTRTDSEKIVRNNFSCENLTVLVSGMQEGDTIYMGNYFNSSNKHAVITQDGTYVLKKVSPTSTLEFEGFDEVVDGNISSYFCVNVIGDTAVTEPITIEFITSDNTLIQGYPYNNRITSDMITAANAKGWTIYAGGVEQTV